MWIDLFLLFAGLSLVLKGGDIFVAAAVRLAELLHMPRVVIGTTLVSLATTGPELVVSIMAGLRGESGLAVGNAVGSVLCNIGLVLGVAVVLRPLEVQRRSLILPVIVLPAAGVALFAMTLDLRLSSEQGALLFLAGFAYFAGDFYRNWRNRKRDDVRDATRLEAELASTRPRWLRTPVGCGLSFAIGGLVLVFGSRLLVDGAVQLAAALGIPSMVVGLTVVAVGTSLPELMTAVTSARQSASDLGIGNVLGANIANLTLILGTAALFGDVSLTRTTQLVSLPLMLMAVAGLCFMLGTDRKLSRREGVILLASYALYLVLLLGLTAFGGRLGIPGR